jgi:hypothetical protein
MAILTAIPIFSGKVFGGSQNFLWLAFYYFD